MQNARLLINFCRLKQTSLTTTTIDKGTETLYNTYNAGTNYNTNTDNNNNK